MSLDIMRWLESFYMWILIGVIVFSCCCYCLEPLLVNRMHRGDVLHDPKCEVYQNVSMHVWEHPHRISMPPDNRIPHDNRLQSAQRQQNEIVPDRLAVVNVPIHQNQNSSGGLPYSIINPSVPANTAPHMSNDENFVHLPKQSSGHDVSTQRSGQPLTSNNVARRLLNQRPNVETPPPAFETAVNVNQLPSSSNSHSGEDSQVQRDCNDPPPPYPGPPPGESSL